MAERNLRKKKNKPAARRLAVPGSGTVDAGATVRPKAPVPTTFCELESPFPNTVKVPGYIPLAWPIGILIIKNWKRPDVCIAFRANGALFRKGESSNAPGIRGNEKLSPLMNSVTVERFCRVPEKLTEVPGAPMRTGGVKVTRIAPSLTPAIARKSIVANFNLFISISR